MRLPRWLTNDLASDLIDLDDSFRAQSRTGPLLVEIHYRSGVPLVSKVRDAIIPPALFEMRLAIASTS